VRVGLKVGEFVLVGVEDSAVDVVVGVTVGETEDTVGIGVFVTVGVGV
jgi:hypothetical protein